ncbi:glycosyltransferase, partial [Alistipes shahii]
MKLTIFTPTYNRGYCLDRLYKSLCTQSNSNFIWLIVDDGS